MLDSFVVTPSNQGCHGDDVLGIIVGNSFERSEFPLAGLVVTDDVGSLDVHALLVFDADEVHLPGKQLPHVHFIPVVDELVVDDVLDDFLNVLVPVGFNAGIPDAGIFEVILVV